MRTLLPITLMLTGACGSCGGAQLPSSDRTAIPVQVDVVNGTGNTIYLASQDYCGFGPLAIEQAGEELVLYAGQSFSCESAKRHPCPDVGSCAGAGVRPLAAGEHWTTTWDGSHYVSAKIDPDEAAENCGTDCVVVLPAEAGPTTVTVQAYERCDAEGCDCEVESENAACYPAVALSGSPELTATGTVTVPESGGGPLAVELRFE